MLVDVDNKYQVQGLIEDSRSSNQYSRFRAESKVQACLTIFQRKFRIGWN